MVRVAGQLCDLSFLCKGEKLTMVVNIDCRLGRDSIVCPFSVISYCDLVPVPDCHSPLLFIRW